MRVFLASLAAFVAISVLLDDGGAETHVVTGTVTAYESGERITVINDTTDPGGVEVALRSTTVYHRGGREGATLAPGAIRPGSRATVWYRSVGEGRPVADRVALVHDANL